MSVIAALEAALAESPDDPLVYAAYADALADAGDPRGEFVRLQMAHDAGQMDGVSADRELRRMWRRNATSWQGFPQGRVGYYRLDGACPVLRLSTPGMWAVPELVAHPARWLLRGVWASWRGNADPVRPFFELLVRTRVRTLRATGTDLGNFGDARVCDLIESGLLERLTELYLPGCHITDTGAEALAAHRHTPRLKVLDLDRNHLSPIGHAALAAVGVRVSDRQLHLPGWRDDASAG